MEWLLDGAEQGSGRLRNMLGAGSLFHQDGELVTAQAISSGMAVFNRFAQPFGHMDQGGGFGGAAGFGGAGFNVDLNDALESFLRNFGMGGMGGGFSGGFGGGGGGGQRGRSLQLDLKVSLREAAKGAKKTVKLNKQVPCQDCGGSGAAAGSKCCWTSLAKPRDRRIRSRS